MTMIVEPDTNEPTEYISVSVKVPEEFGDLFTHFYYAANHGREPVHKKLVPMFRTIMVFNLGSRINGAFEDELPFDLPDSLIIGPLKKSLQYTLHPGAEMLVANFKWDAFYRFFGQSLQSFSTFIAEPRALTGDECFTPLWLKLKGTPTLEDKVKHLLDFSLPYLRAREEASARIIGLNVATDTFNPVKKIAAESGYSERSVQLSYKKHLGFSDKEVTRYQRFMKAVELLMSSTEIKTDWFEIAESCGYYDQSHMIHDFKHYLHLSPTQFLKLQENMCVSAW